MTIAVGLISLMAMSVSGPLMFVSFRSRNYPRVRSSRLLTILSDVSTSLSSISSVSLVSGSSLSKTIIGNDQDLEYDDQPFSDFCLTDGLVLHDISPL